eukprot:TRINITY_DN15942_c0_g1_i1.p1 TRINITY_DN15942_c0_g1~~TRINITY_DN15942_c0_g1_i1.p1  ORF type:complete len:456 (+),score=80.58 TRINITY_DN15942_c0_g1_i1:78-1370(+)
MAGVNSKAISLNQVDGNACFGFMTMLRRGLAGSATPPFPDALPVRPKVPSFGPSARALQDVKDTLKGEADCFCAAWQASARCLIRLSGDEIFLTPLPDDDEVAKSHVEDALHIVGMCVECLGTTVSMSRNSNVLLRMTFDNEKTANLWATKTAVAGGNSESISKLFSIQRSKIQALEQHTEKVKIDNEEVERCLNFLSREYVDMRHQVRAKKDTSSFSPTGKEAVLASQEALHKSPGPQPVEADDLDPISPSELAFEKAQVGESEPEIVDIDDLAIRHQSIAASEPEKEPPRLDTPRPQTQLDAQGPELGRQETRQVRNHAVAADEMPKQGRGGVAAAGKGSQRAKITAHPPASVNTRSSSSLLHVPQEVSEWRQGSPGRGTERRNNAAAALLADRVLTTRRSQEPGALGAHSAKRLATNKSTAGGATKR